MGVKQNGAFIKAIRYRREGSACLAVELTGSENEDVGCKPQSFDWGCRVEFGRTF